MATDPRFPAKTDAGHLEIRERSRSLSRTVRTLLVLTDGSRSPEQLLQMVQGATAADLQVLVEGGLISLPAAASVAPAARPAAEVRGAAPAAPVAPTVPAPLEVDLVVGPESMPPAASSALGYRELYDSLNALVKEQLGLFKGYKFSLEIEKASGLPELEQVARRFVDEVQRVKGESNAQMVRRALGLSR